LALRLIFGGVLIMNEPLIGLIGAIVGAIVGAAASLLGTELQFRHQQAFERQKLISKKIEEAYKLVEEISGWYMTFIVLAEETDQQAIEFGKARMNQLGDPERKLSEVNLIANLYLPELRDLCAQIRNCMRVTAQERYTVDDIGEIVKKCDILESELIRLSNKPEKKHNYKRNKIHS
jgi:gas vesicle protein